MHKSSTSKSTTTTTATTTATATATTTATATSISKFNLAGNKTTTSLTNGDELDKTVKELNMKLIRIDYLYNYVYGFSNRLKYLLNPKIRKTVNIRLLQLEFMSEILRLAQNLNSENKAYLIIGAIQYVQGRWGQFPSFGPLYELSLKRDDFERVLCNYAEEINLEKLLANPRLVKETADAKFLEWFGKYTVLRNMSPKSKNYTFWVR